MAEFKCDQLRDSKTPGAAEAMRQVAAQAYEPDFSRGRAAQKPGQILQPGQLSQSGQFGDSGQLVLTPVQWQPESRSKSGQPAMPSESGPAKPSDKSPAKSPEKFLEQAKPCEVQKLRFQNDTQEMAYKLKEVRELFPTLKRMQDNNVVETTITRTPEGNFKIVLRSDKPRQIVFGDDKGENQVGGGTNASDSKKVSLGQLKKLDLAAEQSFTMVSDGKGNFTVKDVTGVTATVAISAFGKTVETQMALPPSTIERGADGKAKPGPHADIARKMGSSSDDLLKLVDQLNKWDDRQVTVTRDGQKLTVRQEGMNGKTNEVQFTKTGENTARVVTQSAEGSAKPVPGHPKCTQITGPQVSFDLTCHSNGNIDSTNMSGSYVTRHGLIARGVVGGVNSLQLWRDGQGGEHLTVHGWQRGALGRSKPMMRSLDAELNQR